MRAERTDTQRSRLIAGMIEATSRHGYAATNVTRVIAEAGVSRPTFYEHFADWEACFLSAQRELGASLVDHVRDAVAAEPPARALQGAVRALTSFAQRHPQETTFLTSEAMAGGSAALDQRDRQMREIARLADARAAATKSSGQGLPDLPSEIVIGAVQRLLSGALRHGEPDLQAVADDLDDWLERYRSPSSKLRWHTLRPGPELSPSPHVSSLRPRPPEPLPPGRPSVPSAEVARNHRERLLYVTALLAARKGYTATTLSDITAAARLDKRTFYKHFRDKQQAFLAVHELTFQQTMAMTASGYFSAQDWPERIWRGLHAAAQFFDTYPLLAYTGFVESYALGESAVGRMDDHRLAFQIFLQEGSRLAERPPSPPAHEAIGALNFEIGYRRARAAPRRPAIARQLPLAAHLVLTPYLGYEQANRFVRRATRESQIAR